MLATKQALYVADHSGFRRTVVAKYVHYAPENAIKGAHLDTLYCKSRDAVPETEESDY